jgi:hypothetical protein
VVIEFANEKAAKHSEADVSADMYDREFLRRCLRLAEGEFCADHAPLARGQGIPGEIGYLQARVSKGVRFGQAKMKWKVSIVGPAGTVYIDTDAFKLLYPFPTKQEAEAHAECFCKTGIKLALSDERGNLSVFPRPSPAIRGQHIF